LNGLFLSPVYYGGSGTYLALLQVGFTKLPQSLGVLVSSYLTFSPLPCGIIGWSPRFQMENHFSCDLPSGNGYPRFSTGRYTFCGTFLTLPCEMAVKPISQGGAVRITDHLALWSSDFPPLPNIPLNEMLGGATISSPSIPPFSFFPYGPPLNRLICQTVCLLVLFSWDGFDIE